MEIFTVMLLTMAISTYLIWFGLITRKLTGPKVWPLVGSLPGLMANKSLLHDWIAGNLRRTRAGTYQTCICAVPFIARTQGLATVTCNPINLEHILRSRFENYPKGPRWQAAFHELLGRGIFNSDGQTWLLQRKTAALEFTTRSLKIAMGRWVNRSIKFRLCRILEIAQVEHSTLDIQDLLLRLTFDNICGLAFGKDPETLSVDLPANSFAAAFDKATEATLQRFIYPEVLWKFKRIMGMGMEIQLKKSVKIVDSYLAEIIAERKAEILNRSESVPDDLLSRFMKKKDGDTKSYSSAILREIALNFILAGRDTSSVALSWFFWLLMKNPRVETKIIKEIVEVLKKTRGGYTRKWLEEPLCFEEVDRLVYLKAALSETLRLYPSVPEDSKYVISDDILPDGTVVPAGSSITYSIYSMGRMESIWGEDCLLFRPERWLSAGGDTFEPPDDHYKFVAFNAGPRTCLGKDLAYLQMKSIAAAILLRHRVVLVPGHVVEQKISLTLFMKNGLRIYVEPRVLPDVDDSRVDTAGGDDTTQA